MVILDDYRKCSNLDKQYLERMVQEEPYTEINWLALADYCEENGDQERADHLRKHIRELKAKTDSAVLQELELAQKRGVSNIFLENWLEMWILHHEIDCNWDYIWMNELRFKR